MTLFMVKILGSDELCFPFFSWLVLLLHFILKKMLIDVSI